MNCFLEYEFTPIPQFLKLNLGKYYNNTLGNGIFWSVLVWSTFHLLFESISIKFLKRFAFAYHVRTRLLNCCWYLLFFIANILYCKYKFVNSVPITTVASNSVVTTMPSIMPVAALTSMTTSIKHSLATTNQAVVINNDSDEIETLERNDDFDTISKVLQEAATSWDFIFMSSFYCHVVIWEVLKDSFLPLNYLFFCIYIFFCYCVRSVGIAVTTIAFLSIVQITVHLTRLSITLKPKHYSSTNTKRLINNLIRVIFYATVAFGVVIYIFTIPFLIAFPLLEKAIENPRPLGLIIILTTLWSWLLSEIYFSPLKRLISHLRYHRKKYPPEDCLGSLVECTMFKPRDDIIYNLKMLKIEIKERQARMLALRKPKNGADMLVQTLRCMVAINRKIKTKQQQARDRKNATLVASNERPANQECIEEEKEEQKEKEEREDRREGEEEEEEQLVLDTSVKVENEKDEDDEKDDEEICSEEKMVISDETY